MKTRHRTVTVGHLKVLDWQGVKGVATGFARLPRPDDVILLHDRHWSGKQALLEQPAVLDRAQALAELLEMKVLMARSSGGSNLSH